MSGTVYRQPLPALATPLVDPSNGRITDAWLQFLRNLSDRTGGAAGPAQDLGTVAATGGQAAQAAQLLAVFAEGGAPAAPVDLGPVTAQAAANAAAVAELQAMAALADVPEAAPVSDDAALLGFMMSG